MDLKLIKLITSMGVAFYETNEGGIRVVLYSNGFVLGNFYLDYKSFERGY